MQILTGENAQTFNYETMVLVLAAALKNVITAPVVVTGWDISGNGEIRAFYKPSAEVEDDLDRKIKQISEATKGMIVPIRAETAEMIERITEKEASHG